MTASARPVGPAVIVGLAACLLWSVPPAAAQHYSFKRYAQADGLRNLAVNTIAQDCT